MSARLRVVLRESAVRDLDRIVVAYRDEAGASVAGRWVDAFEELLGRISTHPHVGSPRYADELELPGVRVVAVDGFPHLVFYVPRADHVDVWRVLHGRQDIPDYLRRGPQDPA